MIIKCNTCDMGFDDSYYFRIKMNFITMMKDKNTGQEEEVTGMFRTLENFFCHNCYDGLLQVFEELFSDNKEGFCTITGQKISELPYYHSMSLNFECVGCKDDQATYGMDALISDEGLDKIVEGIETYLSQYGMPYRFDSTPDEIVPSKKEEGDK